MNPSELSKNNGIFRSLGKVYSFTLIQILKSKANIATLILMMIMAMASVPAYALLNPDSSTIPEIETGSAAFVPVDYEYLHTAYGVNTVEEYLNPSEDLPVHENPAGEADSFDEAGYGFQTAFSVLIMIISTFSATYIIRSVTEEKISKLVELLMVSISPFTLIFGKILAVLTFICLQLVLLVIGWILSYTVSGYFMNLSSLTASIQSILSSFTGLNAGTVLLMVFSMILSIFAFALLAGLAGAGCSSMDDTGNAMGTPMVIVMLCYLVSITSSFMNPTLRTVFSILPFLSGFIGPSQYLLGSLSLPLLLLGFAVQLLVVAALVYICGKVYRDLLIYSGKQLKMGDILKMAFQRRSGKEAA